MVTKVDEEKYHFVLVHGAAMGGWCWFKVASLLRQGGHKVSAPDLRASGLDSTTADEVATFADYTHPLINLLHAIPADERVVLVGHSLGGLNISLAAELFPTKVSAAVFLAAFMPQPSKPPTDVLYHVREAFILSSWCVVINRCPFLLTLLWVEGHLFVGRGHSR